MSLSTAPQVHIWTRAEYHRMAALNFFDGRRVELIEGQVIDMAAMKSPHAVAVDLVHEALKMAFGDGYYIRQQKPFVISDISEPEPDVAVVPGSIRDYATAHPTVAALIVEVADSSLSYDRETKGSLYAKAGVAEYWIVNLVAQQLEVYQQPVEVEEGVYGWGYGLVEIYGTGEAVTVAQVGCKVRVADLF
ncbi:MAG: Uma2 family endonuclease [Cyanobacteria bacterium P01_H01_bin.119]